jgi:hypothetical protein
MSAIPKDFHPRPPVLYRGTNGQPGDVWTVFGTANWHSHKGGASWSHIGYEFESKAEAEQFYQEHKKIKATEAASTT